MTFQNILLIAAAHLDSHHENKSSPFPPINAPSQLPLAQTLNAILLLPAPAPLPPTHELKAAVTAAKSPCGTRIQREDGFVFLLLMSSFSMSIGIEVPVRPRNWERAEVR